jgi:hypothetical protein
VNPLVVRVEFDTSVVAVVVRAVEVTIVFGNGSVVVTVPDCALELAEAVVAQTRYEPKVVLPPTPPSAPAV